MNNRRSMPAMVALLTALSIAIVLVHTPVATAARRRILNVHVRLAAKIASVDWYLTMQQRSRGGGWTDISKVAPCYRNATAMCTESRIEDPGSGVPALPGLRTKNGAYYRFVFNGLAAGTYRFTGLAYYLHDAVGVPFKTQIYRIA